jgi:hypothetical protein
MHSSQHPNHLPVDFVRIPVAWIFTNLHRDSAEEAEKRVECAPVVLDVGTCKGGF